MSLTITAGKSVPEYTLMVRTSVPTLGLLAHPDGDRVDIISNYNDFFVHFPPKSNQELYLDEEIRESMVKITREGFFPNTEFAYIPCNSIVIVAYIEREEEEGDSE